MSTEVVGALCPCDAPAADECGNGHADGRPCGCSCHANPWALLHHWGRLATSDRDPAPEEGR